MQRAWPITALIVATVGIALAYMAAWAGIGGRAVPLTLILCIATMHVAMMALGAGRRDAKVLAWPFAGVWLVLVAGFAAALALPAESIAQPALFLGLPRRAAIVVYGVGLLPLFALPLAYAWAFDRSTLTESDLIALRTAAAHIIEQEQRNGTTDLYATEDT